LADVADVTAVRGDDERGARGQRGGEPGRDEEVRVDDVGLVVPRRCPGSAEEPQVPRLAARTRVEHGALALVPARVSRTARSTSCPRASSASSRSRTKTPRSGASGPGYICETSRIRTACG